jgi:hypothetical protein
MARAVQRRMAGHGCHGGGVVALRGQVAQACGALALHFGQGKGGTLHYIGHDGERVFKTGRQGQQRDGRCVRRAGAVHEGAQLRDLVGNLFGAARGGALLEHLRSKTGQAGFAARVGVGAAAQHQLRRYQRQARVVGMDDGQAIGQRERHGLRQRERRHGAGLRRVGALTTATFGSGGGTPGTPMTTARARVCS